MKRWTVSNPDLNKVNNIAKNTDLSALLSYVMVARGYDDTESLTDFFDSRELSDPFLLTDMDKAVEAINGALEGSERICVYGDYDCDGVTASAILYDYLLGLGADVISYIPEREEGYGLNVNAIDKLSQDGVGLIVTVDNGISAIAEADYIAQKGIKLVVTDHHQPLEELPKALAVVNPHRFDCFSPFRDLCGAGVALKLCAALDGGYDMVMEMYSDLAALGTIADIVPLKGENRVIVSRGLEQLKNTENLGLIQLISDSGIGGKRFTATDIAFSICPRINAAGRFGSPKIAFEALVGEDESVTATAHSLSSLNDSRKKAEAQIFASVLSYIDENEDALKQRVLVVSGRNWHHGVIGIVASKLLERFGKPVVILSCDGNGIARGSARSMPGFNIFKCFDYCKDVMIKYGGHECAGGLTLSEADIPKLRELIAEYAKCNHSQMPRLTISADKLLKGEDITVPAVMDLRRLEPCGCENQEPIFALSGASIKAIIPLKSGEHTKLELVYDGVYLRALLFGTRTSDFAYKVGEKIDIMATLSVNEYKGSKSVSIRVMDYRLHGIRQDKYFLATDAYASFKLGEKLPKEYLCAANPSREELVSVYKYLVAMGMGSEISESTLYERLHSDKMNAFKLSVIIDAFCDTGLAKRYPSSGTVGLLTPKQRVDIEASQTLACLRSCID